MSCGGLRTSAFFHSSTQIARDRFHIPNHIVKYLYKLNLLNQSTVSTGSTTMTIHVIFPREKYDVVMRKGG